MNRTASQQIERSSEELYKMEDFYRQKQGETRKLSPKEKEGLFQARSPSFEGKTGIYHADYLTNVDGTSFQQMSHNIISIWA